MYKLDDEFKVALKLDDASEEQRNALFTQAEQTVNNRANLKLAAALNEKQLDEFEQIASEDQQKSWDFLNKNFPTWEQTEEWKSFRKETVGDRELSPEEFNNLAKMFAGMKWLSINVPNYLAIVSEARDEIFEEVVGRKS